MTAAGLIVRHGICAAAYEREPEQPAFRHWSSDSAEHRVGDLGGALRRQQQRFVGQHRRVDEPIVPVEVHDRSAVRWNARVCHRGGNQAGVESEGTAQPRQCHRSRPARATNPVLEPCIEEVGRSTARESDVRTGTQGDQLAHIVEWDRATPPAVQQREALGVDGNAIVESEPGEDPFGQCPVDRSRVLAPPRPR